MKIKLVFADWCKQGKSIYNTPEGIDLSMGSFHSGTTFDAEIDVLGEENSLRSAIRKGFEPHFYVVLD